MKVLGHEIKGIIFDIDGTLIDSCGIWAEVDINFFKKRNINMPHDYSEEIGHIGLDKAADYTIERFNLKESKAEIIKEWKESVYDQYAHHVGLKPHVKEFLLYLKEHHIPFCAATANDADCYKSCLIHNEIYDLFDFILEVGSFGHGKENPEIYNAAADKLGIKPNECMVFEDLPLALKTATLAGYLSVGVFDQYCKLEDVKKEISNIYIKDYNELFDYIEKE